MSSLFSCFFFSLIEPFFFALLDFFALFQQCEAMLQKPVSASGLHLDLVFLQNTYFHWLWSLRVSVAQNIFLCPLAALRWVSKFMPRLVLYCLSGCGTNKHKPSICQNWPQAEQPEQGEINLPTCLQCKGLKALACQLSGLPLSGLGPAEAAVLSTEVSLPQMDGFGEGKWLRRCWCCVGSWG